MKTFGNYFFTAAIAAVLVCAFCGILSFSQDQMLYETENLTTENAEWLAVRTEAFARLDKDGKGYIDANDWPGRNRAFRLMDVNRDGRVTLEEFQSPLNRWLNRSFENLDLNGDRMITRDEWMDIPEVFDQLDRNKDSMILRHEFYTPR